MPSDSPTVSQRFSSLWQRTRRFIQLHSDQLLLLIVGVGVLLRLRQYAANISFWGDEAFLVLNLQHRGPWQLLGSLDLSQTAPPAFLIGARVLGQWLGITEYSTRLIPLLSGCLALVLFAWLARRILAAPLLAATLFALSTKLIEHSAEFKQYSSDVLVTVILLGIAVVGWQTRPPLRRLMVLCLVTAPLLWLSEAAVFVYAGLSVALAIEIGLRRPARLLACFALNLIPLASFIAIWMLSIRHQQYADLYTYWKQELFDPARWYLYPVWLGQQVLQTVNYSIPPLGVLVLGFAVVGFVELWRTGRRQLAWMLVLPLIMVALAASCRLYPMGGRVTLFLCPTVLLLAGFGIEWTSRQLRGHALRFCQIAVAAIVVSSVIPDLWHAYRPRCVSHVRPAVRYLQQHRKPGEAIYLAGRDTLPIVRVYGPELPLPESSRDNLKTAPTEETFWLLFEFAPDQGIGKRRPSIDLCTSVADEIGRFEHPGGWAIHYRRRAHHATMPES